MADPTINHGGFDTAPRTYDTLLLPPQETTDAILVVPQNATPWPIGQVFQKTATGDRLEAFDGTRPAVAVAPFEVDATAGDTEAALYTSGRFNIAALIRTGLDDAQAMRAALAGSRIDTGELHA